MGKQIRRTITITLTETWTFVWAKTDDPLEQIITVVPTTPIPKEEPDETLQTTVNPVDRNKPGASEPTPPPAVVPTRSATGRRSRRTRRYNATGSNSPDNAASD